MCDSDVCVCCVCDACLHACMNNKETEKRVDKLL